MADVDVTITRLTPNSVGTDLIAGGEDHNTGETGSIDVHANHTLPYMDGQDRLLLLLEEVDGSTASIVFDKGDYPPSPLAEKGSLTVALAANDLLPLVLEAGRFLQNDGTITYTVTGGVKIWALRIPYPEVA